MGFKEIGQLDPVGVLNTAALFEIEQGGDSFKTSLDEMLALIAAGKLSNLIIDANKDWLGFTISNLILTTPTIADFINATHNHETASGGGQLDSTLALLDTSTIAYLNTPNVYTAGTRQDFLGDIAGTAGMNVGGIAGNPTTQVDGDIWLNTSTNQLFARVNGVDLDIGATPPFDDNTAIVKGSADPTKLLRFELDGFTTATTRVITPPDTDITLLGENNTATVTNKTITLATNTITGTFAEFNTAVTDATLVDLDDVQTLTNKTINSISNTITITKSDISDFPIVTADITDNNVTFPKLVDIATQTFIGRTTAASGDPEELTATQATAVLNVFTDTLKGLVPLSGGGTTNFLRADGTFASPSGAGEQNTISSDGGGLGLTATISKVGVDLRVRSLAATLPISVIEATNLITISSAQFGAANSGHVPLSGGGSVNFLRADGTWDVPPGTATGDMILAATQTVTGAKTFADNAFLIQNPAITFAYLFQGGAIIADRTINLPVLTGNDTLVFEAHAATLTNKTIALGSNTISGTFAQFNTAVTDATLVDLDDAQTLTNKTIDAANNTITNIGASEVEPGIINDQTAIPALEGVDTLLIFDNSLSALRKITLAEISPITVFTISYDTLVGMDADFHPISAHVDPASGTELNIQSPLASAGTLERMAVQINANGQAGITIWKIRINGADGNQTISIPASTTGFFQDVTNTDTTAVGDLVCYQNTGIAGGAYQLQGASMVMLVT